MQLDIIPAVSMVEAPIERSIATWLAKATANTITLDADGELKIGTVVVPPYALAKSQARCGAKSLWLGDFVTAQECADVCASLNDKPAVKLGQVPRCRFFAWRSVSAAANQPGFVKREFDGCFAQHTARESCPEGWDTSAEGQTFGFYKIFDYVASGRKSQAARWWASYEQVRVNAQVLQAISGEADQLCSLREKLGGRGFIGQGRRMSESSASSASSELLDDEDMDSISIASIVKSVVSTLTPNRQPGKEERALPAESVEERMIGAFTGNDCTSAWRQVNSGCSGGKYRGMADDDSPEFLGYMCCMANKWLNYNRCSFGSETEPVGGDCDYYCEICQKQGGTYSGPGGQFVGGTDASGNPGGQRQLHGREDEAADKLVEIIAAATAARNGRLNDRLHRQSRALSHLPVPPLTDSPMHDVPTGGLVVHTRYDAERSCSAAQAARQLQLTSSFAEPVAMRDRGSAMCGLQCSTGTLQKRQSGAVGLLPSTTQKLSIALSNMTASKKRQQATVRAVCPDVLKFLPSSVTDMCICEPNGAFGFILTCTAAIYNPLSDSDEPWFKIVAELNFSPCATTPSFGLVLGINNVSDSNPYKIPLGPIAWDGRMMQISLPPPFVWGISFANHRLAKKKCTDGSCWGVEAISGKDSWLISVLKEGVGLEAGVTANVKLEGNLARTIVDIGFDLCMAGPFGLGEICLGENSVTSVLFPFLPFWWLEDTVLSFADCGINICPEPVATLSKRTLSPLMQSCIDHLEQDYATCGMSKKKADARFVDCARAAFTPAELAMHDGYPQSETVSSTLATSSSNGGVYGEQGVFMTPPPLGGTATQLTRWWLKSLSNVDLPKAAIAELAGVFDCEHYTDRQSSVCTCEQQPPPSARKSPSRTPTASKAYSSPEIGAMAQPRKPSVGKSMGCVADSVGMNADPLASNGAQDVVAVTERLRELGYASSGGLEHQLRTMACASEAVHTFEDVCDEGIVPCAIQNVTCPNVRATERSTCLRNETCAVRRLTLFSPTLDWLRAENAPQWQRLHDQGGIGYVLSDQIDGRRWATDWLVDGLERAGRRYALVRANGDTTWPHALITVAGASSAEGGGVPGVNGFQSGMEVALEVPAIPLTSAERRRLRIAKNDAKIEALRRRMQAMNVTGDYDADELAFPLTFPPPPPAPAPITYLDPRYDRTALEMQMTALVASGFEVIYDDPNLCGSMVADAKLCTLPDTMTSPMDTFIARVPVPRLGTRLPLVYSASLLHVMEADDESAEVEVAITGETLSSSIDDAAAISIGETVCTARTVSGDSTLMTVVCALDASGPTYVGNGYWLRGQISVESASGGVGTSCSDAAFFVPTNTTGSSSVDGAAPTASELRDAAPRALTPLASLRPSDALRSWTAFYQTTLVKPLQRPQQTDAQISQLSASQTTAPSSPPLPSNVTAYLAMRAAKAIDASIDVFSRSLTRQIITEPMHAICADAWGLRDRIRAYSLSLTHVRPLILASSLAAGALNLTAKLMLVGASDNAGDERAVMSRCWQVEALSAAVSSGISMPAASLRAGSKRLAASVDALRGAWESGDAQHVFNLAQRVQERGAELNAQQQLAFTVAQASQSAQRALAALAAAIPPDSSVVISAPLGGKLLCKFASSLDRFATRVMAALPQLQYVARPLGKMLAIAEDINSISDAVYSALASPEHLKQTVVEQVTRLLTLIRKHPMELVHKGTDLLKKLGHTIVAKLDGFIDKIFDFLASLPGRLKGVGDFFARQFEKLKDVLSIEQAINSVSKALNSKTFCDTIAIVKKYVKLAEEVITSFIPDGDLKDKLLDILESVRMISSPSDLLHKYVNPLLNMLWGVSSVGQLAGNANSTLGAALADLSNNTDAMAEDTGTALTLAADGNNQGHDRADGLVERTLKMVLEELRARGMAEVDRFVSLGFNMSVGVIDDLAEKAGNLGADLFEQLMPEWIPETLGQIVGWIHNAYQTLRFTHQLVNNTQPIIHLLEKPRQLMKLACASPGCDGTDAPDTPDLSSIAQSTNDLFGGALPALTGILGRLNSAADAQRCAADASCAATLGQALSTADAQLGKYAAVQEEVLSLEPFVGWYGVCGSENAHRSKSLGLPLEMLAQFWRSLTHPGGLVERLEQGLCREQQVRARYDRYSSEVRQPAYEVPDWLQPHFCSAARTLAKAGDAANTWIDKKAEDIWGKILHATNWAADELQNLQEWATKVLHKINEKLNGVKQVASDVLHKYVMPVRAGLDSVLQFVDKADSYVRTAQKWTESAKSVLALVNQVSNAGEAFEMVLPENLKLGGLRKLKNALAAATDGMATNSSDCNQPYEVAELIVTLKSHWRDIKQFFGEVFDGMSAGEWKAIPAKLLSAFGGGVCFIRRTAATAVHYADQGVDMLQTFMNALEIGLWKDPPVVDCQGSYTCLMPVRRATRLYYDFFFPVSHIFFWDLTKAPMISTRDTPNYRFTVPGLVSKYALQSSTIFKLLHTQLAGMVPETYVLAYRPMEERAPPNCTVGKQTFLGCDVPDTIDGMSNVSFACKGRASLLSIVDQHGTVLRSKELLLPDGFGKWSGEVTGIAVRRTSVGMKSNWESDKGTVYVCGRACTPSRKRLPLCAEHDGGSHATGETASNGDMTGSIGTNGMPFGRQLYGGSDDSDTTGSSAYSHSSEESGQWQTGGTGTTDDLVSAPTACRRRRRLRSNDDDDDEQEADAHSDLHCPAETEWEVLRFDLSEVDAEGEAPVKAIDRQPLHWLRAQGASRCLLAYMPSKFLEGDSLWVGASVATNAGGKPTRDKGEGKPKGAAADESDGDGGNDNGVDESGGDGSDGNGGEDGGEDDGKDNAKKDTANSLTVDPRGQARQYELLNPPFSDGKIKVGTLPDLGLEGISVEGIVGSKNTLTFGGDVQGFAFFDNKFGKPHIAVARCSFTLPTQCAIEFHFLRGKCETSNAELTTEVQQPFKYCSHIIPQYPMTLYGPAGPTLGQELCDTESESGCTLQMAIKIPAGIGSLSHDSSVGALPHQYFHASYIGATREHFDQTQKLGREPEDRIFLLTAPILQSQPTTVTKNWVALTFLGDDLITPQPLFKFKDKDGEEEEATEGDTSSPDDSRVGRRLQHLERQRRSLHGRGHTNERVLSRQLRRVLSGRQLQPSNNRRAPAVYAQCDLSVKKKLMEPYIWKPLVKVNFGKLKPEGQDGFKFCFPIIKVPIKLQVCVSITTHLRLSLDLLGQLCFADRKLVASLIPRATWILIASAWVELCIVWCGRGGLEAELELLTLQPTPEVWLKLMDGVTAGYDLWLIKPPSKLVVIAFVDTRAPKIPLIAPRPKWKRHKRWKIYEITKGRFIKQLIATSEPAKGDTTSPTGGEVSLRQLDAPSPTIDETTAAAASRRRRQLRMLDRKLQTDVRNEKAAASRLAQENQIETFGGESFTSSEKTNYVNGEFANARIRSYDKVHGRGGQVIIDTSGFVDEDTEVVSMRVTVGASAGGTEYLEDVYNSTREQYVGFLTTEPPPGKRIVACAEAANADWMATRVCGAPTVWDAMPPKLLGMWVFHTGFEQYMRPWCPYWETPQLLQACGGHCDSIEAATAATETLAQRQKAQDDASEIVCPPPEMRFVKMAAMQVPYPICAPGCLARKKEDLGIDTTPMPKTAAERKQTIRQRGTSANPPPEAQKCSKKGKYKCRSTTDQPALVRECSANGKCKGNEAQPRDDETMAKALNQIECVQVVCNRPTLVGEDGVPVFKCNEGCSIVGMDATAVDDWIAGLTDAELEDAYSGSRPLPPSLRCVLTDEPSKGGIPGAPLPPIPFPPLPPPPPPPAPPPFSGTVGTLGSLRDWEWEENESGLEQMIEFSLAKRALGSRGACFGEGLDMLVNSSFEVRFQIQLADLPSEAATPIGEVLYGISSTVLTEPDDSFVSIGHGKTLEQQTGQTSDAVLENGRLEVVATKLQLQHATRYWIHIWACDMKHNCVMHLGYPIYVDLTPPVAPPKVYADVEPNGDGSEQRCADEAAAGLHMITAHTE